MLSLWRVVTMSPFGLLMGSAALRTRFVFRLSALVDALRFTGRLMLTDGTWTWVTVLFVFSRVRQLSLEC